MSKKNLTKQQKIRIKNIQRKHSAEDETGLVITSHGKTITIQDNEQNIITVQKRQKIDAVSGDIVTWQPKQQVVTSILKRKTELKKPDKQGRNKVIAANIEQMLIVCAPLPKLGKTTLDQYLVTAYLNNLEPFIICNKTDLSDNKERLFKNLKIYENLGYKIIHSSVKKNNGLNEIKNILQNKSSIIVGQSGVGKSSIINSICPGLNLRIGSEDKIKTGKHTTTASTLHHLPFGGSLIDSPGVHNYPLPNLTPNELIEAFPECNRLLGECRFKNCNHKNQLGCAIEENIGKTIHESRFNSINIFIEEYCK